MYENLEHLLRRKVGRSDFLKLAAVGGGATLLPGCGAESGTDEAAAPGTDEAETVEHPPIEQEPGNLRVFDWAGYELPELWGPYGRKFDRAPKFTFLTSEDQAIGRIRAGFQADLVHPCIGYVDDWIRLGVVQPFDPELLPNLEHLSPKMVEAGQRDGQQYFIPADWGYDSILYRTDRVEPESNSWNLLYDERYAGRISWWDNNYNLLLWGLAQGVPDPWDMTDEELEQARSFLTEHKGLVRNFWESQTELDNDFAGGNYWIVGDAWAGSWMAANDAGLEVEYMDPDEGRISWICGFMLFSETANYRHAHEYVDAWISQESAEWLIENYAYGHANTNVDLEKLPKDLVDVMNLDDPNALESANFDRPIPRRDVYNRVWDQIKAA